jgi:hypothetical protein
VLPFESWARNCTHLRSPGINSMKSIPPASVELSYRPARLHRLAESILWNRLLGSLNVYKYGLWAAVCFPGEYMYSKHRYLLKGFPYIYKRMCSVRTSSIVSPCIENFWSCKLLNYQLLFRLTTAFIPTKLRPDTGSSKSVSYLNTTYTAHTLL